MRPAFGRTHRSGGDGLKKSSRRSRRECALALLLICLALLSEAAAPPEGESWGAAGEQAGQEGESGEGGSASSPPTVAAAAVDDGGATTMGTGVAGEDAAGKLMVAEDDLLLHPRRDQSGGEVKDAEAADYETVLRDEAEAMRATTALGGPVPGATEAASRFAQKATDDEEAAETQISLVQSDKEADLEGLLMCNCTVVGETIPQRPLQLWLDMKQQCSVNAGPGKEVGQREEAAEAPTAHPSPRLKRQLPDPDEYFMAEKQQQPVRLFPGSDDEQRADQAGPVPIVEGLQQCDPSLSERANMASVKMGAKVLAANPEATRLSEVLRGDPDTYLKSDCKTKEGRWLVLELPQVIKVEAITLSVMEVYSSRLKTIHVLGRDGRLNGGAPEVANSRNSSEWSMIAELRAENRRGLHVFILPKRRWAKFLQFRFEGHYGNQMVCAVNEIEVFGLTKAEEILKELEAVAGGPEVGAVNTEQQPPDQAEQPLPSAQHPPPVPAPANGKAEGLSAGADSLGGESGGADGGPREAEGGAPSALSPAELPPEVSSQAADVGAESPASGSQASLSKPSGKDTGSEGQKAAEEPNRGGDDGETGAQGGPAEADPSMDAAGEAAAAASAQEGGSSGTQQQQQEEAEEGDAAASVQGQELEAGVGLAAATAAALSGASARSAADTAGGERQPQDAVSELRLPQTALHPPNASAVINMEASGSIPSVDMIEFAASLSAAGARGPSAVIDMFFQELKVQKLEQVYNKRYMKDAVANITFLFAEHDELVSSLEGEIGTLRSSLKALESSSHTRLDQASVQERRLRKAMEEAQEQLRELSASVSALQRQQVLLLAALCVMVLLRGGSGGRPAAAPAAAAGGGGGGAQTRHTGQQQQNKPSQQEAPEAQPSDTLKNGESNKGRRGGKGGAEPGKKRQQQQPKQQQQVQQPKQQRLASEAPLQRQQLGAEGAAGSFVRRVRWVFCAGMLVVGWLGLGDANFEATGSDLLKKAAALWP